MDARAGEAHPFWPSGTHPQSKSAMELSFGPAPGIKECSHDTTEEGTQCKTRLCMQNGSTPSPITEYEITCLPVQPFVCAKHYRNTTALYPACDSGRATAQAAPVLVMLRSLADRRGRSVSEGID